MKNIGRFVAAGLLVFTYVSASVAADAPRKSGAWEITVTVSGQSPLTSNACIDAATDGIALTAGSSAPQSNCEEASAVQTDQRITIASICRQGNSTVTTGGTFSGDLETAYSGEIVKNYSPPLYGRTEIKSKVEARYLGNCS